MYRKEPVVVGHMELHERQVFSQCYETPLWTKDVAVEPGRYEVVCYDWDLEHPGSYYVRMHGVITTDRATSSNARRAPGGGELL